MDFIKSLETLRTPFGNSFFQMVTWLGEEMTVVAVICFIYWCRNKQIAYRLCFSYMLSGLVVQGMKISFRIERPWVRDPLLQPVESARKTATGYSFPSGHTQSATAMFGTPLFKTCSWWNRIALLLIICAVGFSRMYLGVHTPADVLTAFTVSLLCTGIVNLMYDKGFFERYRGIMALLFAACCAAVALMVLIMLGQGMIAEELASDCVKAVGAGVGFLLGWYLEQRYIDFSVKCKHWWMQVVKYVTGVTGAMLFKSGLKLVFGELLFVDGLRYALTLLWITFLFPLLIKKMQQGRKKK